VLAFGFSGFVGGVGGVMGGLGWFGGGGVTCEPMDVRNVYD